MLPTVFAVAFAMTTQPPAPAAHLHIGLAFDRGAPAPIEPLIAEEAARVWTPYGVAVGIGNGTTEPGRDFVTLHVELVDKPASDVNDQALGSILFLDSAPGPTISLYAGTASDLVSLVAAGSISRWTIAYHNAVMGRVLGRALAHEIGHYLLNTRAHSPSGLMRAVQPILELMDFTDSRLVLSADQQALLHDKWRAGFSASEW